jgi:hypothetical protein
MLCVLCARASSFSQPFTMGTGALSSFRIHINPLRCRHGGREAADFCAKTMYKELDRHLPKVPDALRQSGRTAIEVLPAFDAVVPRLCPPHREPAGCVCALMRLSFTSFDASRRLP